MTVAVNNVVDRIAADVRQLVDPIHAAVRGRVVTHPPLLDQLRLACVPSGGGGSSEIRRAPAGSRPCTRLDPLDALLWIYGGLMDWRTQLNLPHPPQRDDWQKGMMRSLVGAAPKLTPAIGHLLSADVSNWWHEAAVWSGWNPRDLLKLR